MEDSDLQDRFLLYGDIEDAGKKAEIENLQSKLSEQESLNESLRKEVDDLRNQINCLVQDKATLERNIMAIYNTALREMKRKDSEIAELRRK